MRENIRNRCASIYWFVIFIIVWNGLNGKMDAFAVISPNRSRPLISLRPIYLFIIIARVEVVWSLDSIRRRVGRK